MAVVTNKQFYMDNNLMAMVDIALERHDKNWDNLWLFDGEEGAGKSTFAAALCYYIAQKTKTDFSIDNVFFNLDDLINYAAKNEGKVILWDEAALGALASQWQYKTQNKLVQALMVARKKRHFWVFCIPKFHELRRYIVYRSIGLIHVYSPDGISRGNFTYYKKQQKNWLYDTIKRTKTETHYARKTFAGKFIDYSKISLLNWDEYDAKKDDAIEKMFDGEEGMMRTQEKNIELKYAFAKMAEYFNIPQHIAAQFAKTSQQNISTWVNLDRKYAFLEGVSPEITTNKKQNNSTSGEES